MCRGLYLIIISLAALLIMIMYKNKNTKNTQNINNKENFHDGYGRRGGYGGGHGYGGGRWGHGGGGRYYGGGGYGYRTWWDPYYSSFGDWFSYPNYSSYSGRWRQCPQGSICPPYLSCNDPYCQ